MKKGIVTILVFCLINFVYSEKKPTLTHDNSLLISQMKQSMDYKGLIRLVDSLQLTDEFALNSKVSAQISLGLLNDAISSINYAVKLYPQNVNLLGDLSEMTLSAGLNDLTLEILNKATAIQQIPQLMSRKAEIYYFEKKYKESLAVTDSILNRFSIPSVIRLKARNLAALNKLSESQKLLENQYANDKNDYLTFRQLSNFYMAIDSIGKLIIITDEHLKTDSTNTEIINLNAKANYLNNNFQKAVEEYQKLIHLKVSPNYDQCFFMAMSFYRASDTLIYEAFKYMLKADSLAEGEHYPLKYYLGQMAEKTGRIQDAVKFYKQALAIVRPDTIQLAQIFNKLGKMQMLDKRPFEAIKSHQTVLRYNSDDTTAILSLGLAYEYIKDYNTALKYYRKVIELLPDTKNDAFSNKADQRIKYINEKYLPKKK